MNENSRTPLFSPCNCHWPLSDSAAPVTACHFLHDTDHKFHSHHFHQNTLYWPPRSRSLQLNSINDLQHINIPSNATGSEILLLLARSRSHDRCPTLCIALAVYVTTSAKAGRRRRSRSQPKFRVLSQPTKSDKPCQIMNVYTPVLVMPKRVWIEQW